MLVALLVAIAAQIDLRTQMLDRDKRVGRHWLTSEFELLDGIWVQRDHLSAWQGSAELSAQKVNECTAKPAPCNNNNCANALAPAICLHKFRGSDTRHKSHSLVILQINSPRHTVQ